MDIFMEATLGCFPIQRLTTASRLDLMVFLMQKDLLDERGNHHTV